MRVAKSGLFVIIRGCWALLAALALFSSSRAADQTVNGVLYITNTFPELVFTKTGAGYQWEIFPDDHYFDIVDITGGNTPFRIYVGSPEFSMCVNPNGNVGFGLEVPLQKLHAVTASSPALRLEQDSTQRTGQAYDVMVNEFGFYVNDVTSGTHPFSIHQGAPNNGFVMQSGGNVGIGAASPAARLHGTAKAVSGSEAIAQFDVSDDVVANLQINNASTTNGVFIPRIQGRSAGVNAGLIMEGLVQSDSGVGPAIVYNAAKLGGGSVATRPLVVYRNNNIAKVTVAANGNVTATSFINASSRTLKDNIVDLDSRKASNALRQLTPVEFTYKDDPTADPRVGFIAEDVPEIVAEADRKSVPIMDVVALVTRVVKDQQQTITDQQKLIGHQQQELEALKKSLKRRVQEMDERFARMEKMLLSK